MNQISKTDKRYKLLLKIPRVITSDMMFFGYILKVNKRLTIKLWAYWFTEPSKYEYEYYFRGRKHICYNLI